MLKDGQPGDVGMDPERLEEAFELPRGWVASGEVPGVALLVARRGVTIARRCFGVASWNDESRPVEPETVFLIASLAKPVTATAVAMLIERGLIQLDQTVASVVPEFARNGKHRVRILHLLTHTSGLPDMLPNNEELRAQHAPLEEFVRQICELWLDFPHGTAVQYQSCGFAILGEVVRRVDGRPLRQFLAEEIFSPLGMSDSFLGAPRDIHERIATVNVPNQVEQADYGLNSDYWRSFGAPWGGMFSTVGDLAMFLQMFLDGGPRRRRGQVLSGETVQLMTRNHIPSFPGLGPQARHHNAWGLGWQLRAEPRDSCFGRMLSQRTFGHMGATGTLFWADPDLDLLCVVLTNQPGAATPERFGPFADAIAASVVE